MRKQAPHRIPAIDGLSYRPGFLDDDAQRLLLERIDAAPWRQDLERRVQHYGWRYDYRSRRIAADMRIGPLPDWLAAIATLSLGDDWEMRLRPPAASGGDRHILLMRGSVLVMAGEARWRWRHGIDKRKRENSAAGRRARRRRLSVTFRTVRGARA